MQHLFYCLGSWGILAQERGTETEVVFKKMDKANGRFTGSSKKLLSIDEQQNLLE